MGQVSSPLVRAGLAVLALLAVGLTTPAIAGAETQVQIGDRFYQIRLPENPQGAPLILALHGGGGGPAQFSRASGLAAAAVAQGYAVAFPAGSSRRGGERLLTWNGGYCCGWAARQGVDDQAFLRAVIADAVARYGLDGRRVFVTGMSNGAIMAESFAAQNPGLVRAVAGVAGTMDTGKVRVAGPVPALVIHGTADTMVPYAGGKGDQSLTQTDFASVASVVQAFVEAQSGTLARTERAIDRVDDGTSVSLSDWVSRGKVRVRLITVTGGAHHWPGGRKTRLDAGKTQEIDANAEILAFFAQYL
jgi:polyhydroxybutyrate depolymerase